MTDDLIKAIVAEIDKFLGRFARARHVDYDSINVLDLTEAPWLEVIFTTPAGSGKTFTIALRDDINLSEEIVRVERLVDEWLATIDKEEVNESSKEKLLGKIDFAEFGTLKDFPFCIGLQLGFKMNGSGVMDGGKYTVNISPECRWEESERHEAITKSLEFVHGILEEAKVNYVSELVNKPVEITLENRTFKSFRILTEVL